MAPIDIKRIGWVLVACWVILSAISILRQYPGLDSDPAWGLLAAKQKASGSSSSILSITEASPHNLDQHVTNRVSFWAPSYQAIPYFFTQAGLSWGGALKLTVFLAWLLGAWGWARYFSITMQNPLATPWLILLFMCFRYSHDFTHIYRGEALLWPALPWLVLINLKALTGSTRLAFIAGAAGPSVFLLKYSSGLFALVLLLIWTWFMIRRQISIRLWLGYALGFAVVGMGVVLAGFPGGDTPASALRAAGFHWTSLWPLGAPVLAITDLDSLARWLFMSPALATRTNQWTLYWVGYGLTFLLGAAALVIRNPVRAEMLRDENPTRQFAIGISTASFFLVPVLLVVMHIRGGLDEIFEARHARSGVLLAIPFIFGVLLETSLGKSLPKRILALLLLVVLFLIPAIYGAATLLEKAWLRYPRLIAHLDQDNIRLDGVGIGGNTKEFYSKLKQFYPGQDPIYYITSPEWGLPLSSSRLLIRQAELLPIEHLTKEKYIRTTKQPIVLILPKALENTDKLEIIKKSFLDIAAWNRTELSEAPNFFILSGR
jgi:hypothetical protein